MDCGRGSDQGVAPGSGKLVARLEDALEDYQRRASERRAAEKREASKAKSKSAYSKNGTDVSVQWLGDPDDAPEADEADESYRVWPLIPAGVDFYDFLVRMNWTDERVLDRQSLSWVFINYQVYKFERLTGLLTSGIL